MLGLVMIPLAVVEMGWAEPTPRDGPAARGEQVATTPHLRVGGRISRHYRPGQGIVHLNAFVPGARGAATIFFLRAGKSSLLLRADADGRLSPIRWEDLYKGDDLDNIRAVIARESDPKDRSHLIHWLVLYPKGVKVPPPWDKEPDTTY
jgi:hypothetical protein